MKRKSTAIDEEESKLSSLLFNKTKNLVDKLSEHKEKTKLDVDIKPIWIDEDEETAGASVIPNIKSNELYANKLKQKYETLIGTPRWAKLTKKVKDEDRNDELLRTVGHLAKKKTFGLRKDLLEIKRFPKINNETKNEGPVITCVEFHPKLSVAMVAGQSGLVSLFSIGGDVNNKLHNFKLKNWSVSTAQFTPDGSEAYISSKLKHNYCIYNLVKAKPKLVQLPQIVGKPKFFVLSPNGKFIATSAGYDEVYLICAKSRELLTSLKHNSNVQSVTFSFDCEQLYSYGVDGVVTIWDLVNYRARNKFYDHGCVTASTITTSPCGKFIVTGSGQGIVNVYESSSLTTREPLPLKTISHLTTKITNLRFNATSEILSVTSSYHPSAIKLVHLPSFHVFCNFPKQTDLNQVETVNFSPNSGYMGLGNNKGWAYLYRLKHYKNY